MLRLALIIALALAALGLGAWMYLRATDPNVVAGATGQSVSIARSAGTGGFYPSFSKGV